MKKNIFMLSLATILCVAVLASCGEGSSVDSKAPSDDAAISQTNVSESSEAQPASSEEASPPESSEEYSVPVVDIPPEPEYDIGKYSTDITSAEVLIRDEDLENHTLPASMFSGNTAVTDVYIEDGVTTIESEAFYGCTSLKSIRLPSTLTNLGETHEGKPSSVFFGCSSLEAIYLPEGIKSIGREAFAYCTSLKTVYLPENGVTWIGMQAFWNCTSMTAVKLPESLTGFGRSALPPVRVIELPDNITNIWQLDDYDAVFVTEGSQTHRYLVDVLEYDQNKIRFK